jgi:hypothetical protein
MKREIVPVLNAEDEYLMENILAAGRIKHKDPHRNNMTDWSCYFLIT